MAEDQRFSNLKVTDDRYVNLLKLYRRQAGGDIQAAAGKILVDKLSDKQTIKWLSVGAGLGDRETALLGLIKEKLPSVSVDLFVAYEANKTNCQHLQKTLENETELWSCAKKLDLRPEPFGVSTDLCGHQFDIITLAHVVYYYRTEEERAKLFQHLHAHLAPGGILWCLVVAKADDEGNVNQQWQQYRDLKPLVIRAKKGESLGGGSYITSETLWEEWKVLAEEKGMISLKKTVAWPLNLGPEAAGETCRDILSFYLDVEVDRLPEETKCQMTKWVDDNAKRLDTGDLGITNVDTLLMFQKAA